MKKFGVLPPGHVPDLLVPGLKVVFCGTALGRVSAEQQAYYANPGNFFWRTLHNTGLTPDLVKPQDYARLLDYGIGLTDLSKGHFGNDNQLPPDALDADALREKIARYQPKILAFTSKTGQCVSGAADRSYSAGLPAGTGWRYADICPDIAFRAGAYFLGSTGLAGPGRRGEGLYLSRRQA